MVVLEEFAASVTCGGLKSHEIPTGKLKQLKLNAPVVPFCDWRLTVNFAELPTGTVAVDGLMEPETEGAWALTYNGTVELRLMAPTVPVIVH